MPLRDHYGNPLSTSSAGARDHYDTGLARFLAADIGAADAFAAAVTDDPGWALAHAALARARAMSGDMPGARQAIAEAQAQAPAGTPREQAHVNIMALLLSGKAAETRAAVAAHLRDHPRDTMVAQLCTNIFGLIGFSGEVGREAELLAFTTALLPHYGDDWWMMSMHALSLCETGQLDASTALMDRALALNPRNAHGAHFRAHAQYEAGETTAGRAYLGGWMADYDPHTLLHSHLSWHLALWALHDGDAGAMWQAVDSGVAPGAALGLPINVVTDTAAILYRAEIAGIAVAPERWRALADYVAQTFPNPGQSFVDIHAALAHAMAGDGARLAAIAETEKGFAADLVRPVARAWGHMARGLWQDALDDLTGVMASAVRLGGSRAQRDLIELAWVHTLLRLGQRDEARRALATRRPVLAKAPPVALMH